MLRVSTLGGREAVEGATVVVAVVFWVGTRPHRRSLDHYDPDIALLAFLLMKAKRGGEARRRLEIEKGDVYVVLRVPQPHEMPQASRGG